MWCDCLLRAPHWGPGLLPRHVPWLGIELAKLWFTGQRSIHWATSTRAPVLGFLKSVSHEGSSFFLVIFIFSAVTKVVQLFSLVKVCWAPVMKQLHGRLRCVSQRGVLGYKFDHIKPEKLNSLKPQRFISHWSNLSGTGCPWASCSLPDSGLQSRCCLEHSCNLGTEKEPMVSQ